MRLDDAFGGTRPVIRVLRPSREVRRLLMSPSAHLSHVRDHKLVQRRQRDRLVARCSERRSGTEGGRRFYADAARSGEAQDRSRAPGLAQWRLEPT